MRSHSFLRKSHLIIRRSGFVHPASLCRASSSCSFKHNVLTTRNLPSTRRFLSTEIPTPIEPEESWTSPDPPSLAERGEQLNSASPSEEPDKDKAVPRPRRPRATTSSTSKDADPLDFPPGLENDILYVATQSLLDSRPGGLPPPEIFEEALDNLLITLHPQNQNRSLSSSGTLSSRPVEPTLGLYCPIEGGDYVLDLTVHELAYQTNSEVLILDAVQLAAGEWGPFGKAASAFNLPDNPLHFSQPPVPPPESNRDQNSEEMSEDGDASFMFSAPSKMSLALPKTLPFPFPSRVSPSSPRKVGPSKLDAFFEALVNMPVPPPPDASKALSIDSKARPRLVYIRDFPTLARSSSVWYPSLLSAVKQRRRSRNVNTSPVMIIFGMTPPVSPPANENPSGPSNLMSLLMNRNSSTSQVASSRKQEHANDWGESETADIAREKRLRSRLRKWEKSTAGYHDEFPSLSVQSEDGENSSSGTRIIMIGSPEPSSPGPLGVSIMEHADESASQFFRSTILVPRTRSLTEERESRIARRRQINELTMRMGVGAVGGLMEAKAASEALTGSPEAATEEFSVTSPSSIVKPLWEDWGQKVEVWSNVRKIADRAMGSVMVRQRALTVGQANLSLESMPVPWSAIQAAWISYHSMITARKTWLKEAIGHLPLDDAVEKNDDLANAGSATDKVVEAVKNDPDLDQHEARLLSCIVDSVSINTTFGQVHLPPQTIDAVRTIVSLPLLHPQAFQHGILKEHSMTGCLLFGPPGTGKTLVVRALAKEAGCRMLAISPSDVMDMYVGEGEKLVKAVFSLARRLSPCVVFLDEIDALFGARMSARESGSAFAHRGVITEFMQEMDGLKSSKDDNVIVIGATNRPFDLDDAVLRRLPRRLLVDLPGEKERHGILKILLRDETITDDVNIESLAKKTDGFSGSDLKHLCVSAALDSVKEHTALPWTSRHAINAPSTEPVSETQDPPAEVAEMASINAAAAELPALEVQEVANATPGGALESKVVEDAPVAPKTPELPRTLRLNNFLQALKEITPSSSETLGSLADLRKWNEEFGEGRRDRKKRQVWGKGRFGFVNSHKDVPEEGRVSNEHSSP
ncbi:hypothetical protein HYPSUDRAFT_941692 [Hypholoma sublateritium FD-334 SS-4]|uniref:AAA+ ATPase domain-containing protein n=1 Tax=Hypholoma sublateritium (strain FD-334 SS-4) TaxID=945553 RepID=A0A0D2PG09_HYPSF|nr:hypothetical protein HYPSUDRAFT_941692 [Hypholoma sublateritium FD-334 SS-4]